MAPGGARVRPQLPAARRAGGSRAEPAGAARRLQGAPGRRSSRATTTGWPGVDGHPAAGAARRTSTRSGTSTRCGSSTGRRREVFDAMRAAGIGVQVNYIPVYWHPLFEDLGFRRGMCPNAEQFYAEELSLPMHAELTDAQVDQVIDAVRARGRELTHAPRQPLLRPRAHHGPLRRASRSHRASGATSSTAGTCTTGSPWARSSPRATRSSSGRRPAPGAAGPPDCATTWSWGRRGSTCSSWSASSEWLATAGAPRRAPSSTRSTAGRASRSLGSHTGYIDEVRATEGDVPITVCLHWNEYDNPKVRTRVRGGRGPRHQPRPARLPVAGHRRRLPLPAAARDARGTVAS